jgi:hypothetical protein
MVLTFKPLKMFKISRLTYYHQSFGVTILAKRAIQRDASPKIENVNLRSANLE